MKMRDNMQEERNSKLLLSSFHIRAIEDALDRGQRIEIVRTKDGVKIYTIKRKELHIEPEA